MSNAAALKKGTARAKWIIDDYISNLLLPDIAKKILEDATNGRIFQGNNMTGNTVNSYAVGAYSKGSLVFAATSSQGIPKPLRRKLSKGQRFYAGSQRWDGDIQQNTFTAQVSTNGTMEAERSIAFLQSYKPSPRGWALVVCNGVEYATYQENAMNINVLTSNFDYTKMFALSMFKPMPD